MAANNFMQYKNESLNSISFAPIICFNGKIGYIAGCDDLEERQIFECSICKQIICRNKYINQSKLRNVEMKIHTKHRCPDCMKDYLIVVSASLYTCDGDAIETNALECPNCGYREYPFYELGD